MKRQKGFTLIELLVVIAIIGVLAFVVMVALNEARGKARDAQRQSDIKEVHKALQLYYSENGSYPSTGSLSTVYMDPGCGGTVTAPDQVTASWVPEIVADGYIPRLPEDPKGGEDQARGGTGRKACYMYSSDGSQFVLSTWATVEGGPHSSGGLYSRAGFRETGISDQNYLCNHVNIGNASNGDYYQYSYTITNVNCTW